MVDNGAEAVGTIAQARLGRKGGEDGRGVAQQWSGAGE